MKKIGYLLVGVVLILNLFFVNAFQESYGNLQYYTSNDADYLCGGFSQCSWDTYVSLGFDKILKQGAKVGEWTHDLDAARALAKINRVPFYIKWGKSAGCANCVTAEDLYFKRAEFSNWAKQNGIPLVYADYNVRGNYSVDGRNRIYAASQVRKLYPGFEAFPQTLIISESDGISLIGSYTPIPPLLIRGYYTNNYTTLFGKGYDVVLNSMDDGLGFDPANTSSPIFVTQSICGEEDKNHRFVSSPSYLNFSSQKNFYGLHNSYGTNWLMTGIYSDMYKYFDLTDWHRFSNISSGKKYFIKAINVSDAENFGKVSFYAGYNNAKNGASFKEMSLNDFRNGYSFTASSNEDIYMKVWMEDKLGDIQINGCNLTGYYYLVTNAVGGLWEPSDRGRPHYTGRTNFNLSYNLEYYQGEGVSGGYVNEPIVATPTEGTYNPSESWSFGQTISDFISLFSSWFSSSDKLTISYSGAVAGEWTTDYNSAKELSIENDRPMVVLFVKSKEEPYSKSLIKNVLNSPALKKYFETKGISTVVLDFSNVSSLSQEAMKLYPVNSLGEIVKLPTLIYLDSNQNLRGVCVYRKDIVCNEIKVSVNVTNFVEILESYTGPIYDLGIDNSEDDDCPTCHVNFDENDFNDTYEGNETFNDTSNVNENPIVFPTTIIRNLAGTVAGEWSTNLSAAEQMASANKKFYIINYGNLEGCQYCENAEAFIFSRPGFKRWAYENGIAMVYAEAKDKQTEPTKTIYERYIIPYMRNHGGNPVSFPFMILVGYETRGALASFTYADGNTVNGVKLALDPSSFIELVDSYTERYRRNLTNYSSNYNINWDITRQWGFYYSCSGHNPRYKASIITPSESGAVAGGWTKDLVAAKELAKKNNVFFIVDISDSVGCSNCKKTHEGVTGTRAFTDWAKQNGIPLVYADTGKSYLYTSLLSEIRKSYVNGDVSLPTHLIIDGDGNLLRQFVARNYCNSSAYYSDIAVENYLTDLKNYLANTSGENLSELPIQEEVSPIGSINWTLPSGSGSFSDTISTSGSVAGEWTLDIAAARNLAKQNGKFYILNIGNSGGGCGACNTLTKNVYNTYAFHEWARKNGIPLVYADYDKCWTKKGYNTLSSSCPAVVREVQKAYSYKVFPTVFIIDGVGTGNTSKGSFAGRAGYNTLNEYMNAVKNIVENWSISTGATNNASVNSTGYTTTVDYYGYNWNAIGNASKTKPVYWVIDGKLPTKNTDNYTLINVSSSVAVVGEWTTNLTAAKELAKKNGRFYYVLVTSQTCSYCVQFASRVLATDSFTNWAKTNGIPLVYGDAWKEESKYIYPEFVKLGYNNNIYYSGIPGVGSNTIPIIYLIDGAGNSTNLIKTFQPHSSWMKAVTSRALNGNINTASSSLTDAELNNKSSTVRHIESIKGFVEKYGAS